MIQTCPVVHFLLHRFASSVLTLLVIAVVTFTLVRAVPGGPFSAERSLPEAVEANLIKRYRLDEPAWLQFTRWLGNALRGDLGPSFTQFDRTANDIIRDGFPRSALLGTSAFCLAFAVGVPAGALAALSRRRFGDRALMTASVIGVSVPSFILASLLQYALAYRLGWLPTAGWGESWSQIIMPAVALAAFPAAFISRLVRSSLLAVLTADFIRTARAKGVPRISVIGRHALRNALLPAVTYAGPLLAALLTGSFVVEDIFAIPGLGQFFVSSIRDRDYTVLMGVTLFYAALLITFNTVVDMLYAWLDPRIGAAK